MKLLTCACMCLMFLGSTTAVAQGNAERYTRKSVLSEGKWVKISVDHAGVYQLTNSALRNMGFSNPDQVRLYGLNLEILPETRIEDIPDDLVEIPLYRTDSKVLFYGRGTTKWTLGKATVSSASFTHVNNPYASAVCYFLTESNDSLPQRFNKYAYEVEDNSVRQTRFPEHALVEKDEYSFINSGRTFFEQYDYANGNTRSYTISTPGNVGGACDTNIDVQFCAAGGALSTLSVALNDSTLGTMSFSKLANYQYGHVVARSYVAKTLVNETNNLRLTHQRENNVAGHLDFIRVSYMRQLDMAGQNELLFRPYSSGSVQFEMTGGKSETVFWHVNDLYGFEEVDASYDPATNVWTIPFTSPTTPSNAWRSEELIAVNPSSTFPTPTVIGKIPNQNLHALDDLDLVIVVPASGKLTAQAQRLADAHTQYDAMHCAVVRADQIYNEFSAGTPDATAIRRFMKMLYDRNPDGTHAIRNLCLFGDGVWDNRMITPAMSKKSPDDYLLCYESDNSVSHTTSYVLEDYYALLDDKGTSNVLGMRPRIGVGRIPTTSATEARDVVTKLITYMSNQYTGAWKNTIAVLCDDGNDNMHMQAGDSIITMVSDLHPDYNIKRIYWDTYNRETSTTGASYPSVTKDIDRQMQEGALIFNYTGHGAPYCLSHEQVLRTENFADWSNSRLPLWITAACDVAPFDMNVENLAEVSVLNPKGGALGILSTARTVYADPNLDLNLRFMEYVLDSDRNARRYTLGEALALAKTSLIDDRKGYSENRAHFVLLGDPAIKLAAPTYKVEIDRINDMLGNIADVTIGAGEIVNVEGHIVDEEGALAEQFNGSVYPIVMDNIELVTCKNNPLDEVNGNRHSTPYSFYDRLHTLYVCADSVQDGRFSFSFPIPLDNNYSGASGLISLYAVNATNDIEASGHFDNFLIGGTAQSNENDHVGPDLTVFLNSNNFRNGDKVNEAPLLIATLYDKSGINMTGRGVGHDITVVVDEKESMTYSLNSYFSPTLGDYRSGSIQFPLPELDEGYHFLTLRAFDVYNNPRAKTVDFYVNVGKHPQIFDMDVSSPACNLATFTVFHDRPQSNVTVQFDVYDMMGRKVWQTAEDIYNTSNTYTYTWNMNESDSHLTPGIYIVRAGMSAAGGTKSVISKKFVVKAH